MRFEESHEPALSRADSVPPVRNNSDERSMRLDDPLVCAAKHGSSEAFDELQRIYSRRLYRTIYAITKNAEDTEDALQDTFLRAYSSLSQFQGRAKISSWLTRIAINSALGILRKRRARPEVLFETVEETREDSPHFDPRDAAPNPEEIYDQRQRCKRLLDAIQGLRPILRTPALLYVMEGYSIEQIGRVLGISAVAVKSRLHRARLRISAASQANTRKPARAPDTMLDCRNVQSQS